MPIYKYRSLEQAEAHLKKLLPADPLVRFDQLEDVVRVLKPRGPIQRGIFKFKTLAEANEHRQQFER